MLCVVHIPYQSIRAPGEEYVGHDVSFLYLQSLDVTRVCLQSSIPFVNDSIWNDGIAFILHHVFAGAAAWGGERTCVWR